jgi:hypothetical protein
VLQRRGQAAGRFTANASQPAPFTTKPTTFHMFCAGVTSKAWAKLLDVFGDLEAAWQDSTRRQQFLSLPIK